MIKQQFDVERYWRVVVLYNWDYNFLYEAVVELHQAGFPQEYVFEVLYTMYFEPVKAVTCSNTAETISVVIFNRHKDPGDYLNSIVHEAEHIKQVMLYAYKVEDTGEPPAYTMGYLVRQMWKVFRFMLCVS